MKYPWPMVALGEVLRRCNDIIALEPTERYREVTVRLWGKGVVLRGEVKGQEIGATRRFRVREGQFVLSRIDARNGAFGLVPTGLDGAVVSNDFPSFEIKEGRLLPAFLEWLSRTRQFVELCKAASEGTTNRVRLQEDRFLSLTVPLPALSEQRRIVAKVEELATKIEEARGLRFQASEETISTHAAARLRTLRGESTASWRASRRQVEPAVELLGRIASRSWPGHARSRKRRHLPLPTPPVVPTTWTIVTAGELQEAGALLDEAVHPDYLVHFMRSGFFQDQLAWIMKQTTRNQVSVLKQVNLWVILPPLEEQRAIVAHLDSLQTDVRRIGQLQAQTAAELDALLPSILDKAFKGEL